MNTITIEGNLTRDPELRFTKGGKSVANFSVAVNRSWMGDDGERQRSVSYFDCSAWEGLADNVVASLKKGDRVLLTARPKQRSYENAEGRTVTRFEHTVDAIGPSLRWATASPVKVSRSAADDQAEPAEAVEGEEEF
jgi:single-strand DNA-binding protein